MKTQSTVAIVIPSLEPDIKLLQLLETIRKQEDEENLIVVVNDGSDQYYDAIFDEAEDNFGIELISYDENRGKGHALKTAFKHIINKHPYIERVATIDSDGQHTYKDTIKCIEESYKHPDSIIFGSRNFEADSIDIPKKSRFGNVMTSKVLDSLTGYQLNDTQTGLRIFPVNLLGEMLDVKGERFEYEMNMIIYSRENDIEIIEVPISTIYINDNKSTHFNPIKDSLAIYQVFIKYILSSITGFLVDISIFALIMYIMPSDYLVNITLATVIARIISSTTNYLLNKNFVFKQGTRRSAVQYFSLVVVQMLSSSVLVSMFSSVFSLISTTLIKVFVDLGLFLASYFIQKTFIFKEGEIK